MQAGLDSWQPDATHQSVRTKRYLTVLVCFGFYCFLVGCAINYPQCELEIVKAELKIIIISPSHQRIAQKIKLEG
jgi:hypothetical protein